MSCLLDDVGSERAGAGGWVCATLLGTIWLAACGGNDELQLVGLRDGDYVGGPQVSMIDVKTERDVLRAELFLDRLRIAADELAPFDLVWDARRFDEGRHRLTARAYLDGGMQLEGSVEVSIDNTPPVVGDLAAAAAVGGPFEVTATDNGEIARIEVSRGHAGEPPLVLTTAPYRFKWSWCGPVSLEVRAVDAAGGQTTRSFAVTGVDEGDLDCDGYVSDQLPTGNDCDDNDPTVHPGAPEGTDKVDHDCDGVPGFVEANDADHDGVPSIAAGGNDCNDADPTVHGDFYVVKDRPITIGGQPVLWKPGEAAIPAYLGTNWQLYLNRGGQVDLVSAATPEPRLSHVASGANPGSIAADLDYVAFGRGNQVVIEQANGTSWSVHSMIDTDAPVGALAYVAPYLGAEYAAYQAGTRVWFASRTDGAWTTQLLIDAAEPLAEPPVLSAAPYGANVAFRTAVAAWTASRFGTDDPLATHRLGPLGFDPTAVGLSGEITVVAVDTGAAGALYIDGASSPAVLFPRRITRLAVSGSNLFVQLEGLETQVLLIHDNLRNAQTIPNVTAFDASAGPLFVTSGHVFVPMPGMVFAPIDTPGDGIDQNCDGLIDF